MRMKKYYKLGDNESIDSSFLRSQALTFTTDQRRRRERYISLLRSEKKKKKRTL